LDNNVDRKRIRQAIETKMPEANIIGARVLFLLAIVFIVLWVIFQVGYIKANSSLVNISLVGGSAFLLFTSLIVFICEGKGKSLKYLIFFSLITTLFLINVTSGYKMRLAATVPLILSLKYCDKKFTQFCTITDLVYMFLSSVSNAYLYDYVGFVDLNTVKLPAGTKLNVVGFLYDEVIALNPDPKTMLTSSILLSFIPSLVIIIVVYIGLIHVMESNLIIVLESEDLVAKQAKQKMELAELKTKMMLSQIQPHFTYNTLSSIAALCDIDPQKAKSLTMDFTNYLRANLKTLKSDIPIFFDKEMEHTQIYLRIEKERFGDILNYDLDICASEFFIPSLTIQPLVENAVKHGVCSKSEGGHVLISSYELDEGYEITVEDDGIGFDEGKINWNDGTHTGIMVVKERLERICNGTLTIESEVGKGTKATIFLPKEGVNQ